MSLLSELKGLRHAGVQNRPTPRAVQVLVVVVIAGPAIVLGVAGALVAEVLTVNWPTGGDR